MWLTCILFFFFFNDTATTEIYTLSLHDALPISLNALSPFGNDAGSETYDHQDENHLDGNCRHAQKTAQRSEEHTSELQSLAYIVCRLLLEKKKKKNIRKCVVSQQSDD